jgi:ssDNA-binding Zn-finger/Zn-ribbon topoisomerase 1
MIAFMTRKEFSTKSEATRQISAWAMLASMTFLFASLILRVIASFHFRDYSVAHKLELSGEMLLGVAVLGTVLGAAWVPYRFAMKWGMACPKCGKHLLDRDGRAALLTGNCPKCEFKLFSQGIHEPVKRNWLTKEQFKIKLDTQDRKFARRFIALLITAFGLVFVCAPVTRHFQDMVSHGKLDRWLASPTVFHWVAGGILAAVMLPYLLVCCLAATRKLKYPGIPCPECGHPISGRAARMAIDKDFCIYCGTQLFETPEPAKA